jgi:hypothetical protein
MDERRTEPPWNPNKVPRWIWVAVAAMFVIALVFVQTRGTATKQERLDAGVEQLGDSINNLADAVRDGNPTPTPHEGG